MLPTVKGQKEQAFNATTRPQQEYLNYCQSPMLKVRSCNIFLFVVVVTKSSLSTETIDSASKSSLKGWAVELCCAAMRGEEDTIPIAERGVKAESLQLR